MNKLAGISSLLIQLRRWPVESQQGSRRNAMIASTALARRRAEREEVEEFFTSFATPAERVSRASP